MCTKFLPLQLFGIAPRALSWSCPTPESKSSGRRSISLTTSFLFPTTSTTSGWRCRRASSLSSRDPSVYTPTTASTTSPTGERWRALLIIKCPRISENLNILHEFYRLRGHRIMHWASAQSERGPGLNLSPFCSQLETNNPGHDIYGWMWPGPGSPGL